MRRSFLLMLCALLTACAGGAKGLSKEQYARRADAICARYYREAGANTIPATTPALAKAANRTVQLLDKATAQLRALSPPRDEENLARRWLASLSTLREDAARLRDRARANDLAGIRAVVAPAQRHDRTSLRLAAQLGMKVCSTNNG